MTQTDKETILKELMGLSRKQNCFDDMYATMFEERIVVDIFDYNSYFKVCNLLPSITHWTNYLEYQYDRDRNHWMIGASWEDEQSVLQLVEVVTLIVETCMKTQSEFNKTFKEINYVLG